MYGGFIQIHNGIRMEMHVRSQRQTFRMHFVNHVIFGNRIEHASMAIILIAINLSHLCVETDAVICSFCHFIDFSRNFDDNTLGDEFCGIVRLIFPQSNLFNVGERQTESVLYTTYCVLSWVWGYDIGNMSDTCLHHSCSTLHLACEMPQS